MYSMISGFSDEIDASIERQFQVLKKLQIFYFEPRGIDGKNISELSDEEIVRLKERMKAEQIHASAIGSPIGKVKLKEDFESHFALFQRVVWIAKQLNTKYIRMFSFFHDGNDVWTNAERNEVLGRLRRMIAYAKEQDVVLLHENEKDVYGDTVERVADLMRELYCEHFQAVFDPANFVQCGQDTKYAYKVLKDYIGYVHIKDACREDDRVVPAGEGDGNVEYILTELLNHRYNGFISLEPHLGTFDGLANLELDDKMLSLPKGGEGTWTLAYQALSEILNRIQREKEKQLLKELGEGE